MRNPQPPQVNTFLKGMNKDISPELMPSDQYLHAENLVFISRDTEDTGLGSDVGIDPSQAVQTGTNFRLSNVPGDLEWFTLTNVPRSSRYRICVLDIEGPYTFDIRVAYVSPSNLEEDVDFSGGLEDVWQQINDDPRFYATIKCNCLVIRTRLWESGIDSISVLAEVSCTVSVSDETIPAQTGIIVVGYDYSDDDLVFITTSDQNINPDQDGSPNVAQVWRIPIDGNNPPVITFEGSLVYNDRLNVSLRNQCKVIYTPENECIKRVTWADGFNDIRSLNIADADTRFLTPDTTLLSPAFDFPVLKFVGNTSGQLRHGVYVYFVRLSSQSAGIRTAIGPPSSRVNVLYRWPSESTWLDYARTRAFLAFEGGGYQAGDVTGKGNILNVSNIDTRYDTIEIIAAFFTTGDGPPVDVYVVARQDITATNMTISHTTDVKRYEEVSASELAFQGVSVKSPKSIIENNRRLLAINYCEGTQLDFAQQQRIGVDWAVSEITWAVRSDSHPVTSPLVAGTRYDLYSRPRTTGLMSVTTSVASTADIPGGDFNIEDDYADFKGAEADHRLRGYMRGDWYRLGIVFFLKDGTRTPVYWVGDYQFDEPNINPVHDIGIGSNSYWANQVGLSISGIDVSSVADKISGFSIVRSQRAGRVVARGVLNKGLYQTSFNPFPPNSIVASFSRFYSPSIDFGKRPALTGSGYELVAYYEITDVNTTPGVCHKLYNPNAITPINVATSGYQYQSSEFLLNGLNNPPSCLFRYSVLDAEPALTDYRAYYAGLIDTQIIPFGGTNDSSLADTQYYWTGHYQPVDNCNAGDGNYIYDARIAGGDIWACNYARKGATAGSAGAFPDLRPISMYDPSLIPAPTPYSFVTPVESDVNLQLRSCIDEENTTFPEIDLSGNKLEVFETNDVFHRADGGVPLFGFGASQNCQSCFPNRIIATQARIVGELFNAWALFQADEVYSVDIKNGALTEIATIQDGTQSVIFWQTGAFGIIPTSAQTLVASGSSIVLGSGSFFSQHQYMSEEFGCQHQWSVSRGMGKFVWVDVNKRAVLRYGAGDWSNLSDSGNMQSFFSQVLSRYVGLDNPIHDGGIHTSYDYQYNMVIITGSDPFTPTDEVPVPLNSGFTLIYGEQQGAFVSFLTPKPRLWVSIPGNRVLSQGPTRIGGVFQHFATPATRNIFYGMGEIEPEEPSDISTTEYSSKLVFVVNDGGTVKTKILGYFLADMNNVWSEISVATNPFYVAIANSQIARKDYRRRYRGSMPMVYFQPRHGKWLGNSPLMTDCWIDGQGWQLGLAPLVNAVSELFVVELVSKFADKRDISSIASNYATVSGLTT